MSNELRKYETLREVGHKIYGEINPENVLFSDKIFTVEKKDCGYIFAIRMPFVDKKELKLSQKGDEITIAIKNERRSFALPTKLQSKEIVSAKYNDGKVNIFLEYGQQYIF